MDKQENIKPDLARFGRGSNCFARDRAIALNIDGMSTYSHALESFQVSQDASSSPKEKCRWKTSGEATLSIFTGDNGGGVCVTVDTPPARASIDDYTTAMKILRARFAYIHDRLDWWVCDQAMGPKSMTYFVLFDRQEGDIRAEPAGTPVVHFQQYSVRIASVLKNVDPNIGTEAEGLIADISQQMMDTKKLMRAYRSRKPKEEDKLYRENRCAQVNAKLGKSLVRS
ncbi:hypothetical protein TWF694_011446 [Orbilia ellipsospora]|uniref:Uncharacterized protein n=1 Tax=Orbilia ellipsospora TaxID=2528407 RepID=A0AAV9X6E5_9PEZI